MTFLLLLVSSPLTAVAAAVGVQLPLLLMIDYFLSFTVDRVVCVSMKRGSRFSTSSSSFYDWFELIKAGPVCIRPLIGPVMFSQKMLTYWQGISSLCVNGTGELFLVIFTILL